jgi:hypothetical protein
MLIYKPLNQTQERFNALCTLGGGKGGGPARTKVQALLSQSGKQLNQLAYKEIAEHLTEFSDRNPWHICFAVALSWGHLARLDPAFTDAATNVLANWNDADLKVARKFHYERGPEPIEQSLRGAYTLFQRVKLPDKLPTTLKQCGDAQQRWIGQVIGPHRPPYIGSWNATAMFMVALFANPALAAGLIKPEVLLPPGGPIFGGLSILYNANILAHKPAGSELDDQAFEPGALYENNALFEEIHKGHAGWHLIDVHSGIYLLGTRLPESAKWVDLGAGP